MRGDLSNVRTTLPLLLLLGCKSQPPASTAPSAAQADYHDVPIGLCEDHPPESTSEQRMREDFQALQKAGVRVLRVSFGWDDLEPERDKYDFSPIDMVLRFAAEYRVKLIPYVCYTPGWLAAEGVPNHDIYRSPPSDVREFEQLMELLAQKYKGRFATWELWNEPDNREYWLGSAEQYAELVAAGSRGVKKGDPQARVVLGGIAGHLEFLEELLTKHKIAEVVDIVNLHSYSETWNPEPLEGITTYLQHAAELVREHGESEPLWLAEVGYSSFRRGNFVSDWYKARFEFEHTPPFQAAALLRVLAMARSVPQVELIAWYELRDLPPGTEVIGDQNNRYLGVLSPTGEEKPAYGALSRALPALAGKLRSLRVSVDSADSAPVQAFAFQRAEGTCVVVAWLATQQLKEPATRRARFTLHAKTDQTSAKVEDALASVSGALPLQQHAPIRTGDVELSPERTYLITIDHCR